MNTATQVPWKSMLAGLLLAVALVAAPSRAAAQPSPVESAALVEQGKRLYQVGKYREAADAFASAYAASGDPALLYNLAQAARRSGDNARAANAYQTYLDQVPDAPNRATIEERIASLRKSAGPPQALLGETAAGEGTEAPTTELGDVAAPARTDVPAQPTHRREGLFLRLLLGGGAHSFATTAGTTIEGSGFGMALSGAVGFSISPRWAVFGEAGVSRTPQPSGRSYDRRQPFVTDFGSYSFGGGVAFFPWERHNVSVSLSALATQVWYETFGDPGPIDGGGGPLFDGIKKSDFGLGARLVATKEWWVSRDLSLGVAADVALGSGRFEDDREGDVVTLGLALVAGYN